MSDDLASDLSGLWAPAFPGPELVSAAAGLFTRLPKWDGSEGARPRLVIGPGMVAVSEVDPAKRERREDAAREAAWKGAVIASTDLLLEDRLAESDRVLELASAVGAESWSEGETAGGMAARTLEDEARWADHLADRIQARDREAVQAAAGIVSWSRKSRARMVRRLAELDYGPLFAGGGVPAMLTLTYPGDWLAVAPSAAVCKRHVDALAKRFKRAYGRPLVGVWKREFQRRGAPHYHVLMVPPVERVNGENFREWVSRTWAEIVGAASCGDREPVAVHGQGIVCCEWHRHREAGTGLDYAEGMRARDPKRLAVYFSKHGVYAAKDYQNAAPAEWVESGSVGRFWGVWGLDVATVTVEVTPAEALAAARTMRRWQRANGYRVQVEVWRTNTRTGAQRRRRSGVWSGSRMRGRLGFVVVNDGAAFASALARYLDQVRE